MFPTVLVCTSGIFQINTVSQTSIVLTSFVINRTVTKNVQSNDCMSFVISFSNSNKSLLKKLLLDSGGLFLALQPLGGNDEDADTDHAADRGRAHSDWFNSALLGRTSKLHSLYFSLLIGCLSTLMAGSKMALNRKCFNPAMIPPVSETDTVSPPPSKKPRMADVCRYKGSNFDLLLLLDDGTQVWANREAVAGGEATCGVGSQYFRGLLRGAFGEAQCDAEEAIRIKDVSRGMLLPVLHYLHGCRLTREHDEGDRRGRCQVLGTLVLEGLGVSQKLMEDDSTEDLLFHKTALGEVMIGACRFLVTELQRELEDLCMSLLLSCSFKAAEDSSKVPACKTCRENPKTAEENLANRTSELELTGAEGDFPGLTKKPNRSLRQADRKQPSLAGSIRKTSRGVDVISDHQTIRSISDAPVLDESLNPEELNLRPKSRKPAAQDPPAESTLVALLPQVYWFSQRYNYPALGRACLSLLLGCQDRRGPFLSSSLAGECLCRLVREADCTESLKKDLLCLATEALS